MTHRDEKWRDSYDAWKLATPPEYDEPYEDDECYHEDYDADILTGRATCNMCGHSWWQTPEEIEAELRHIAEYDEWCRRQRWREWLDSLLYPFRHCRYLLKWTFSPHKSTVIDDGDDLPF